jgi:hypothetical protein
MQFRRSLKEDGWKMIDPKAKLLAVLDTAEKYRGLAMRAKDRGEREPMSVSSSCMWRSLRSLNG